MDITTTPIPPALRSLAIQSINFNQMESDTSVLQWFHQLILFVEAP